MRRHAIRAVILAVVLVCVLAPVAELFDGWDNTLQSGNDVESNLALVAVCLGAALVLTGILLGGVLTVMVGESAQEMQQAGWLPTHHLSLPIPDWMGVWFATFPNVECLAGQALAVLVLVGSYAWVRSRVPKGATREPVSAGCEVNA